jgi:hypothetical protein
MVSAGSGQATLGWIPVGIDLGALGDGLFVWLISHQPAVLFSQNKSAISNQPTVLFSQSKPAPAISHQPTEQSLFLWK